MSRRPRDEEIVAIHASLQESSTTIKMVGISDPDRLRLVIDVDAESFSDWLRRAAQALREAA